MPIATAEWTAFEQAVNAWFHLPDFLALRACLATAKALDLDTTAVWLMVVGPSGCGKSELYLYSLKAYPRVECTSDLSLSALLTLDLAYKGQGVLRRLGDKGLWLISDFSSVLGAKEETRNQITSACREIFDGEYRRGGRGENLVWRGRVNVVAACTPAIERFYRVHADLGERFLQVQLDRIPSCKELRSKAHRQRRHVGEYHRELRQATAALLESEPGDIQIEPEADEAISQWAEFIARCRTVVTRSNFSGEITDIGYTEGPGRLYQELSGLALGDAAVMQQKAVDRRQLPLIERIALDSLTRPRRAVLGALMQWPLGEEMRRADLQEVTGITHSQALTRVLDELVALDLVEPIEKLTLKYYRWSREMVRLLKTVKPEI